MRQILRRLARAYPDAGCELAVRDPFQVLVATMLSAQCTDRKVNEVLPGLFARYPDAASLARARTGPLEKLLRPLGLFRAKAANLVAAARLLSNGFGGEVPSSIEELVDLPGVGRKTANCVLVNGFDLPGIMCDTHCCRVTRRLGLHRETDPVKIEFALGRLMAPRQWGRFSHRVIHHGRAVCRARSPGCGQCVLASICPGREDRAPARDTRSGA